MYAKNLKLTLGTDNVILFSFLNQDQKSVNIAGMTFVFRLMDQLGENLLVSKPLEITDSLRGRARLILTDRELQNIDPQIANYSIERSSNVDDLNQPVFVDDHANSRGVCEIENQVLPSFVPSQAITIPDHSSDTYYSSQYITDGLENHTIQYQLSSFTGTVQVQGAVDDSGLWYDITESSKAYASRTGHDYLNFQGIHPKIRLRVQQTVGTVDDILIR